MTMAPFLRLEDFLAPPPFPAAIAVLMALGLKSLGTSLLRKRGPEAPPALEQAAGFVLAAALSAAVVHLLALLGLAYLWPLRIMAWALAAAGIREAVRLAGGIRAQGRRLQVLFQDQAFWGKAALVLLGLTVLGLFLAALGPPTDADSLDYHLGVPLEFLRRHGAYPRPDWFFARLAGLGEYLNMLGLAGGTDIFGAILQFAGLVAAAVAVNSLARTDLDKILLAMCVIGCPVVAFLVPNQKPQMLPGAATTIAMILLARRFSSLDLRTITLACGCVSFAMACKYSFLISGLVILGIGMAAASRARLLIPAMAIALASYLVLTFPMHLQNYLFYGDPISPVLERFRAHGDAAIIRFFTMRRPSPEAPFWYFPLNLVVPFSLGAVTTVLGSGIFLLFAALRVFRESVTGLLLLGALITAPFALILSQMGARYLLEPYLWMVAASAPAAWRLTKKLVFRLLVGQMLLMVLVAGYGALTLFPGALSPSLRDKVMTRSANGYGETRWLNEVLPPEAVILANIRSMALMPRPFFSRNIIDHSKLGDSVERNKVLTLLRLAKVNTLIIDYPQPHWDLDFFRPFLVGRIDGPKEFSLSFRNPWNRGSTIQLVAYRLDLDRLGSFKK